MKTRDSQRMEVTLIEACAEAARLQPCLGREAQASCWSCQSVLRSGEGACR
jgi:hypothetical protein